MTTEIFFEAHAPKIIIPQDMSSDGGGGYLLLDTGYLVVKGRMGGAGMSWDVSFRDVNAGLPLTVGDMYTFGEQALYLIQPFNIELAVQMKGEGEDHGLRAANDVDVDVGSERPSEGESDADMTVEVAIKPEIRGELDALKLSRLLELVTVVSATLNKDNCLAAVSLADKAVYNPNQPSRPITSRLLPSALALSSNDHNLQISDIVSAFREVAVPHPNPNQEVSTINPRHITMAVKMRIPLFAFDLTYDLDKGRHLVLSMHTFEMQMVSRLHDMQVLLDLSELSMQDSFRSKNQRDLVRTPLGSKQLIHVSYTTIPSTLSPLYRNHASEVREALVMISSICYFIHFHSILTLLFFFP